MLNLSTTDLAAGKKKARIRIRAKNYHQREDGGNMKKTFNCIKCI